MIWIILALTLGASITSIIHGVFMLFGSLSISGAAIPGLPSTMLAVLPIISAIFALIGGIIAFNQSKWGALFLFIAMGLCVPTRDTWLYGGLYFFAGLFCFFISRNAQEEYTEYYDASDDFYEADEGTDYFSDDDVNDFRYADVPDFQMINDRIVGDDIRESLFLPSREDYFSNEPPRLRRRMSKSCPTCGAVVSRDAYRCPTCGTELVVPEVTEVVQNFGPAFEQPYGNVSDISLINDQLFNPAENFAPENVSEAMGIEDNINVNEGDDMSSAQGQRYRASASSGREDRRSSRSMNYATDAAASYTEYASKFSKGKKRKRSPMRKILSMLLLVAAVGGALYFLLGLRKLPPGELPPMVRPEVVTINDQPSRPSQPSPSTMTEVIAEPDPVAVAANYLPNFTPDRTPSSGAVIGSNVNVRADHSTNSTRVTRLSVGTRVEVIGTFNVPSGQYSGIWYNIRTGGREGWVYGKYLQPLGSGIPAGYSNALLKTFGSSRSQLIDSLGNPTRSTSSSAEWPGLTATLRGEDITRIRLTNSSRELQNGLKPGMSQTALLQIMGYPSSVNNKTMNYNENGKTGLSVVLDRNNAISSITVNEIQ